MIILRIPFTLRKPGIFRKEIFLSLAHKSSTKGNTETKSVKHDFRTRAQLTSFGNMVNGKQWEYYILSKRLLNKERHESVKLSENNKLCRTKEEYCILVEAWRVEGQSKDSSAFTTNKTVATKYTLDNFTTIK